MGEIQIPDFTLGATRGRWGLSDRPAAELLA